MLFGSTLFTKKASPRAIASVGRRFISNRHIAHFERIRTDALQRSTNSTAVPVVARSSSSFIPNIKQHQPQQQQQPQRLPIRFYGANQFAFGGTSSRTNTTATLWKMRQLFDQIMESRARPVTEGNKLTERKLIPKRPMDSWVQVELPFSSDMELREQYINAHGDLRFGKLLEDLDAFAATIAYMHADDGNPNTPPLTIVTASLNRIDLLNKLYSNRDIRIQGCCTWVGTSSMEIRIDAYIKKPQQQQQQQEADNDNNNNSSSSSTSSTSSALPQQQQTQQQQAQALAPVDSEWEPLIIASFTMVARDPLTKKAAPVNPLKPETEQEKEWFRLGEENKNERKAKAQKSLNVQPPTPEERLIIHNLFIEENSTPGDLLVDSQKKSSPANGPKRVLMRDTRQQSLVLCQPQERNIHNKIFGGYLMRKAFELAYNTAYLFCHERPFFLALDDITFNKSVEIGSILRFSSEVVYAEGAPSRSMQVMVVAEVLNPVNNTADRTNVFHFTFTASPPNGVPKVVPETYREAMTYLEGKRRIDAGKEHAKNATSSLLRFY